MVLWTGLAAAVVAIAGAPILKRFVLEEWYLHGLEATDHHERMLAAMRLGEMHSARAVPKLLAMLAEPMEVGRFQIHEIHDVSELADRLRRAVRPASEKEGVSDGRPAPAGTFRCWVCSDSSGTAEFESLLIAIKVLTGGEEAWPEPSSAEVDSEGQLHAIAPSGLQLRVTAAVALLKLLPHSAAARETMGRIFKDAGEDFLAILSESKTH